MEAIGKISLWVKEKRRKFFKMRKLVEYTSKEERFTIVEKWKQEIFKKGKHKSMVDYLRGNVFIQISPYIISEVVADEFVKPKRYEKLNAVIPDEKKPIVRHKAVYTNLSSPYGIYSESKNQFISDSD